MNDDLHEAVVVACHRRIATLEADNERLEGAWAAERNAADVHRSNNAQLREALEVIQAVAATPTAAIFLGIESIARHALRATTDTQP